MAVVLILAASALAVVISLTIALARRHGDGVDETVRSFDEFRHALDPELDKLDAHRGTLAHRLDLVDEPVTGPAPPPDTPSAS